MGADDGYAEEGPSHSVTVPAFLIEAHPVTNQQYKRFCDETGHTYAGDSLLARDG